MLNDLRKLLESEQSDDILDLMLEATNDALIDFFIEDDGEAEIDEKEVNAILSKIPAYDEEEAMNKKLEKITECYIPESLTYVEEGFVNKMKLNKLSKEELEEKMRNLENEIEDLNHYVNSDEGTKQHEKRLSKAKKELAEVEKIYKKKNSVQESVESDGECPDDEYLEEGFKGLVGRLKRSFTKSGRAANVNDKHFDNIRKGMVNEFNAEEDKNELIAYKQWVQDCISSSKQSLEETEDKNLKDVIKYHVDWLTKFLKDIDKKIESVQESYEPDDVEIDFIEEGFKDIKNKFKGMKDLHDIKKLNKKFKKQVLKDIDSITDPEDAKKMRTNILNFIERDASFENQGTPQDKEMDNYINWLKDTALPLLDKKMVCEGYVFDGEEYIEEGLFKKRTEVEIEIIYDDWEAHCSAYAVGDDVHCLKSVTIDLPEEFHSGSDKSNPKGNWEEALIKVAKKLTKKDFKEFKIKRWFVH